MNARIGFLALLFGVLAAVPVGAQSGRDVVAVVNGREVTAEAIQLEFFLKQLPEQAGAEQRRQMISLLVDRELIRQFLADRKTTADPAVVDRQLAAIRQSIESRGGKPDELLGKLGLSDDSLKRHLEVSIAWEQFLAMVVTEDRVTAEWNQHRQELDGTRVRGAQIIRILAHDAPAADVARETELLAGLRTRILAKELTFAAAAREHSQSPSASKDGDLGEFEFTGRVDPQISAIAFPLKPGEISPPVRTTLGVHLVTISARIPGQLSLEDARPDILRRISQRLWDEQVARLRRTSRIEIRE